MIGPVRWRWGTAAAATLPVTLVFSPLAFLPGESSDTAFSREVHTIPAFSRMYRTACSTCHVAAPKLNVLGEAFRLNGYRMPVSDLLLRRDEPVPLGDDAWKDEWPRAIWPGDVPGAVPLALRIQTDARLTGDETTDASFTYRFPHEVYLLAGAPLGETISAFLETEWSREDGLEVVQAKIEFQDLIPGLPDRLLNVWVGLQNPYLFTFTDRQIDRAGRQQFQWQQFRASNLDLVNPTTGDELASTNRFRLGATQPAIELNGLVGGRLYYGLGLAQGAGEETTDNNDRKDLYYKIRYKLGGLDFGGSYPRGGGPVTGSGGQLLDRSITIEHFGYFGAEPIDGSLTPDRHRSYGIAVRTLQGPWDLGVGYVRSTHDRPWGDQADGEVIATDVFGKLEYLGFPWLIGSLKLDWFRARIPDAVQSLGFTQGGIEQTRVVPGVIALIRQNVRGVVEAELFSEDLQTEQLGLRRPHGLWLRLDVAF